MARDLDRAATVKGDGGEFKERWVEYRQELGKGGQNQKHYPGEMLARKPR